MRGVLCIVYSVFVGEGRVGGGFGLVCLRHCVGWVGMDRGFHGSGLGGSKFGGGQG